MTVIEQRFVEEFVACGSPKEAMRRVGCGIHVFRDKRVQDAIAAGLDEQGERLKLTEAETLRQLRATMTSNVKGLFDHTGRLLDPMELDEDVALAVASIKVRREVGRQGPRGGAMVDPDGDRDDTDPPTEVVEVKFWDKGAAIERGMKHFGLFKRDNEQQAESAIWVMPKDPKAAAELLERVRRERMKREKAKRGKSGAAA